MSFSLLNKFIQLRTLTKYQFSWLRYSSNGKHIVQMRGLDYDTTVQDVIEFFKPLGITPKNIHLNCDGSGRTVGFSEVEFNTHAEAVVALRKKNAFIGNKFIRLTLHSSDTVSEVNKTSEKQSEELISEVVSKVERQMKSVESSGHTGHIIRIKNVPWRMTDQDIFDFFAPVGARPISVQPVYNENGFRTGEFDVQFLSSNDMQNAVSKNNAYFRNKFVHLSQKQS